MTTLAEESGTHKRVSFYEIHSITYKVARQNKTYIPSSPLRGGGVDPPPQKNSRFFLKVYKKKCLEYE